MQPLRTKLNQLGLSQTTIDKLCTYFDRTPYDQSKIHRVYKKGYDTICIDVDHYEKAQTITTLHLPLFAK